jgi:3-hydroxyacyl-[acyl-carrier-protein] dehydratase
MTEDVFNEHFPGYPIFPGSLILEGLAQLSGILFEYSLIHGGHPHKRAALTLVKNMKYRRITVPGDKLIYRSEAEVFYPDEYAVAKVTATCDNTLYASGELFFGFIDILDQSMKENAQAFIQNALKNTRII